jgi:hypothetical protein
MNLQRADALCRSVCRRPQGERVSCCRFDGHRDWVFHTAGGSDAETRFSREFKVEAVKLVRECGLPADRAAAARGQQAEGGAGDPGKGRCLFREGSDLKFGFIAKQRNIWPVVWLCKAMGVSGSGFHAWLNRSPSAGSRRDESASMTAQLVADALLMAVWRRGKPDALMHHSDRGSQSAQYASEQFQRLMADSASSAA